MVLTDGPGNTELIIILNIARVQTGGMVGSLIYVTFESYMSF